MNEIDLRRVDLNLLVVFDVLMEERSVTRAADRLGRTQSAISHALGRLREQLGDPLLVKSGMRMLPSPFAEHLVMEVRPILANIRRVLVPPQAFEPATTTRAFRIAIPDLNNSLFPQLVACIRREAPQVDLEWASRDDGVLLALLEGRVDIALVPSAVSLPDGTEPADVKPLRWASFVRKGHPAVKEWGKAAWNKWPHMAVRVGARMPSPVEAAAASASGRRRITTWVPHFSAVAPLLARTDLIATLPVLVMADVLDRFGLRALVAPIQLEPMGHRLVWSSRLGNDPALRWLRRHVATVFDEVLAASEAALPI